MAAAPYGDGVFSDFRRAPDIADHPDVYERENEAVDLDGRLWRALREQYDWAGRTLLDLGCGTGFWLPRYAADAGEVIGVEPDPVLVARAGERGSVRHGSAEHVPLPDASVDVVHARFAYFFPPGCEPGLAEVMSAWRCRDAAELEAVLRIEFPGDVVDRWVRANPGRRELSYGYVLFTVTA